MSVGTAVHEDMTDINAGIKHRCESCHEMKICWYAPDPFAWEIYDDDTPVWMCGECREDSAMDI